MTRLATKHSPVRTVLLILLLLGLVLTGIFMSRRSVKVIQEASASIYQDRLVPAGILVNLTSAVYRKRLLLETHILGVNKPNIGLVKSSFDQLDRRVDSLLTEFDQTKLTAKESNQLQLLKQRLTVYNQLESELTTSLLNEPLAQQIMFAGSGRTAFSQVAQTLDELSTIQLTIGKELLRESKTETNYIYILTAVQIGLILFVCLGLFWYRL